MKTKKDIEEILSKIDPENLNETEKTIKAIWSFTKGSKKYPIKQMVTQCIHPKIWEMFTDEHKTLLLNGPPPETSPNMAGASLEQLMLLDREEFSQNLDALVEFAKIILGEKFRFIKKPERLIVRIIDYENKIIEVLEDQKNAEEELREELVEVLENFDRNQRHSVTQEMIKQFLSRNQFCINNYKFKTDITDNSWALFKCKLKPNPDQPFDSWLEILDRMSDKEAFAAWVWGVYSEEFKGRRALWLHGDGNDGKSILGSVITEQLFGPTRTVISNAQLGSAEKRFLASFFEKAKIIFYPDANDTTLFHNEIFKSLIGSIDELVIEKKGKDARLGRIKAAAWVCSNQPPHVTEDASVTSRVFYIKIKSVPNELEEKIDRNIKPKLINEIEGFLAFAEKCWHKRKTYNDFDLQVNDETAKLTAEIVQKGYQEYNEIFDDYFDVDPSGSVEVAFLKMITKKRGLVGKHEHSNFIRWLEKYKPVTKKRKPSKWHYMGIKERLENKNNKKIEDVS